MTRTVREWCASAHKEGELMHACSGSTWRFFTVLEVGAHITRSSVNTSRDAHLALM